MAKISQMNASCSSVVISVDICTWSIPAANDSKLTWYQHLLSPRLLPKGEKGGKAEDQNTEWTLTSNFQPKAFTSGPGCLLGVGGEEGVRVHVHAHVCVIHVRGIKSQLCWVSTPHPALNQAHSGHKWHISYLSFLGLLYASSISSILSKSFHLPLSKNCHRYGKWKWTLLHLSKIRI